MEDQLISLETAILAKEKGYDQNPYKTERAYGPEFIDGSNVHLRSSSLFNPGSNTAVAPTQSLLQKWLREKHNIHMLIKAPVLTKKWECHIQTPFSYKHPTHYYQIGDSYEEALEQGLIEALKLLP